ncbi:hypothetical protein BJP34_00570 [Moorena producens PAL-8-15-08-1]|uniref:Replication restart DNA helicase PriA n=1 Tax=Moorena producens PAL-8-15-08-1 TaxID=1458985 RepID=A0A1D8TKG7_9CYAN|nr:hypothetical protein [Moorena producens]AOW98127.1 hypothetical protein BJP34_00570 [Moorena producens PAL-8-15-08-1]
METTQSVRCPNCGNMAQRHYLIGSEASHYACAGDQVTKTECSVCDYLMVMCSVSGNVIEAYAPGRQVISNSGKFPEVVHRETPAFIEVGMNRHHRLVASRKYQLTTVG